MTNFYKQYICECAQYRTDQRVSTLDLLEPETRLRVVRILAGAKSIGIDVAVFETYRSQERQAALFAQGVTQLARVGTHHFGLACDIVRIESGKPTWAGDYTFLGRLAAAHGLIWGGDWGRPERVPSFVDGVHVQRCTVARQPALFDGTWYPEETYDPVEEVRREYLA